MTAAQRRHGGGAPAGPGWRRLWLAIGTVAILYLAVVFPVPVHPLRNVVPWLAVAGTAAILLWLSVRRWRAWPAERRWAEIRETARIAAAATGIAVAMAVLAVAAVLAVEAPHAYAVPEAWRVLVLQPWIWVPIALSTAGLAYALRPVTGPALDLWLRRRALPPALGDVAAAELRRTHLWRTLGLLGGLNLGLAPAAAVELAVEVHGSPLFQPIAFPLCGYLGGVLLCEALRRRPAQGAGSPAARLDVRAPGRYLTTTARVLPAAIGACLLGLLAVRERLDLPAGPSPGTPVVLGVVAGLLVGVPAVHRLVVRRRQRLTDPDALALDDVFRSSAAHAVVGASCAGGLFVINDMVNAVWTASFDVLPSWVRWLFLPVLALPIATMVVWIGYGSAHRGVRPRVEAPAT